MYVQYQKEALFNVFHHMCTQKNLRLVKKFILIHNVAQKTARSFLNIIVNDLVFCNRYFMLPGVEAFYIFYRFAISTIKH